MVKIKTGNILNCTEDIIVHQVNPFGTMGGGIARQLADEFKYLEENYRLYCGNKTFETLRGKVYFYISDKIIANIFSQELNFNTDYGAMLYCLKTVKDFAKENKMSVCIPYGIGCGIANGDWKEVYKIIEYIFKDYDITLYKLEEEN